MARLHRVLPRPISLAVLLTVFATAAYPSQPASLQAERTIAPFGGIPFTIDLDLDGASEILWLQSPGLFHSRVFDKPPWNTFVTPEERDHFCLTATRADGELLWQVGAPWAGTRPFITHCAERAVDAADLDGDGAIEVVCIRGSELLVLDGLSGAIERQATLPADNGQIVRVAHTGRGPQDWTILVKNSEASYAPHEYANPAWFYTASLDFIKTADYLGAGHAPLVQDLDGDGIDEFIIGFNHVNSALETVWTYPPVPQAEWDAAELHVDDVFAAEIGGALRIVLAASDTAYVLDPSDGSLVWKHKGTHPQHCQVGDFYTAVSGNEVFIHNKRAELQLFDANGAELWTIMPPKNFPFGEAPASSSKARYHMFDPTAMLHGAGPEGTDLLVFTDGGWPYGNGGDGQRILEFSPTENIKQDWGEVPGRPDDYGYGFYARTADFDGDGVEEVLINDRRFAWHYAVSGQAAPPRSSGDVLHVDFENYTDGVVQALNAGIRWLGDPFANRNEGLVEVTHSDAFDGARCGHTVTESADQIGRIRLQPRFDAPQLEGDEIIEFVFRAAAGDGAPTLEDFVIWNAGGPAGVILTGHGDASAEGYRVDALHGGKETGEWETTTLLPAAPWRQWTRFVLHRQKATGMVSLWAGAPGDERFAGRFADLSPGTPTRSIELGDTSEDREYGSGHWDDIRVGAPLEPGAPVAPPEPPLRDVALEEPPATYPITVSGQKQLFADDTVIASSSGLTRTLHSVQKHPANPLVVPDQPWEGQAVLLYGAVLRDPESGLFRMWYLAWGKHVGKPTSICYAESEDGLTWTKPNLGLMEYEGSRDNNMLMPGWSQTTILHDPRDPDPMRRYKGVLRMNGTRGFLSPDGIHWEDAGILLDQAYDATTVQWNPNTNRWIAMVKIFQDGKRARGYAESDDFFHWTDTYYLGTVDEKDAPGDQMYGIYPFYYEGLLFGHLRMYHTDTDKVDIQLITSRAGKRWNREIRTPFIPCSDTAGAWDFANNSTPTSAPVRVGDELWFYYAGRSTLHNEVPNTGAIGLGTLRLDGFYSMDAGPDGGILTTQPILLDGARLFVNANAEGGSLAVEILDSDRKPLDGFGQTHCAPISGDGVRAPVAWSPNADLSALKGKVVHLRFHMTNAALYAFWLE